MVAFLIRWIASIIDAISEAKQTIKEAKMRAETTQILQERLKFAKEQQKRSILREKIEEIEQDYDDYSDEEPQQEEQNPNFSNSPDGVLTQLLTTVAQKMLFSKEKTPLTDTQEPLKSIIPEEFVQIIKKAKKWEDLKKYESIYKKYFPNITDDTLKAIWESYK